MKLFVKYKKYNELTKELALIRGRYNDIKQENEDFKAYITDLVRQNKSIKEELGCIKTDLNATKYKLEEEKRNNENLYDKYLDQQIKIEDLKCENKELVLHKTENIEMAKSSIRNVKKYKTVRLRKKKLKKGEFEFLEGLVEIFVKAGKIY